MVSFLLHGLECAFWCFVWHQFHHWWAHSHTAHYTPPPVSSIPPPPSVTAQWSEEFARARQGGVSL